MVSVSKAGSVVGYGTTTAAQLLDGQMELDMEAFLREAGLLPMFDPSFDPGEEDLYGVDYIDTVEELTIEAEDIFVRLMLDEFVEEGCVGITQTVEIAETAAAMIEAIHEDMVSLVVLAHV